MAQESPKPKPADPAAQPKSAPSQESQNPAVAPATAVPGPASVTPGAVADPSAKLGMAPAPEGDPSKMAAAPTTGNNPKPANAAPVDSKSYILGAEDMISILVWRSAEFSGAHMIRPDGKITINLVGEVEAAGLTPEQLGVSIRDKLKKVLVDPDVSVSVTAVNSKRYFIEGEVGKPGEYKLVVPTRVLQALVNAGGFRDFANQKRITIMRGTKRFNFNYKRVISGKNQDENIFLEPDDIIIVK